MTAPTPAAGTEVAGGGSLVCVFAVRDRPGAAALAGTSGHAGGGPLRLLELPGPLWAVVQDVPAADFGEEALRQRLAAPRDLEACARAHHAVVSAAAVGACVVPLPLATLFTDADRAASALDGQRTRFLGVVDRVAGRSEWALKVHVETAPPPRGDSTDAATKAPGSGLAYLDRVRDRQRDRHARQDAAVRAARHVFEAAAAHAADAVHRRPHGVEITGRDRTQILNAALLVDDARVPDLVGAVRALDGAFPGVDLRTDLSGPWVPYSFTGGAGS